MSTQRSKDLANDLANDLAAEDATPVTPTPSVDETPSAVVETAVFLDPRKWSRPRIARTTTAVSVSAGPIRLRMGRG